MAKDIGQKAVAEAAEKENEQGFRGRTVDPTPNENYSVAGVTSGKPTPETDTKAAAKADASTGKAEAKPTGEPK